MRPTATTTVVVAGVSGVGKSSIAEALSARLGWPWADGDAFHSEANKARMGAGIPLTDADRWPWLASIAAWIGQQEAAGESCVVACSALRQPYRDVLRDGHPSVWFAFLEADPETISARLATRQHEFMPAALLASQLATLEPLDPTEPGVTVSAKGHPADVVATILAALPSRR